MLWLGCITSVDSNSLTKPIAVRGNNYNVNKIIVNIK